MRRLIILGLLYVGMQLILPLGSGTPESLALLTFGFLMLGAYTVGEIAESLRLSKIVGYLIAGVVFGPAVLGTLSTDGIRILSPVSNLAIALIAFLAGAELQWSEVKERGVAILKMMSTELALAFLGIFATVYVLRGVLPFLSGAPTRDVIAFGVLFASIAIVHSPAVTLALLTETGARGAVARTTLGIVLLADITVVLFFSGALAFARALVPPTGAAEATLASVFWSVGGAVLVGAVVGGATALYLRFVTHELFVFALLITLFGSELARLLHTEALLTLLTAGFVAENASRGRGEELRRAMERAAAPVFVVFFALAGAHMNPRAIGTMWPLVVPLALVRAATIWGGIQLGGRWAGASAVERRYGWMGLISQSGVAIGLAAVMARAYPTRGEQLQTLFLALIAINESVGPILFRLALVRSGEVEAANEPTPSAPAMVDEQPA